MPAPSAPEVHREPAEVAQLDDLGLLRFHLRQSERSGVVSGVGALPIHRRIDASRGCTSETLSRWVCHADRMPANGSAGRRTNGSGSRSSSACEP
jgi:hypothetical protein